MRFYLGAHHVSQKWWDAGVPLFISRRTLTTRKSLPIAREGWALDSGGFTELSLFGGWRTTEAEYVSDVRRFQDEIGRLEWVAPMDWMCEPHILERTGLTSVEHQRRTIDNFLRLREQLGPLVIPVLQGWTLDDYLRCWERYHRAGVDLEWEDMVGLGTVCRRQDTADAGRIVRRLADNLAGRQLHGFGVKLTGLESFSDELASADSLAWSYDGRRLKRPCPEGRKSCANCLHHALAWRTNLIERLGQQRLTVA